VEILEPGGGMRMLGIPTVVDRLIQQALHQELMPLFDPDFSESSYGNGAFRKSFFDNLELVSLLDHLRCFQCAL
jgi:hypothetical protein